MTAPDSQPKRPGLARRAALACIRLYQRTASPVLPVLTAVCGPACGCRFTPSCSRYTTEAISIHGLVRGLCLGAVRLLRCNPLSAGGDDPVPAPGSSLLGGLRRRPVCRRPIGAADADLKFSREPSPVRTGSN